MTDSTRGRRARVLAAVVALALAAATAAVYRNVGEFAFVFDDGGFILGNLPLHGGLSRESLRWALTTTYTANWHPLTWFSHLLDVQFFGLRPGPHHLVNLLIHLANTLLLFQLLRGLTGRLWRSAFVAALFALHPLHVESVAWVSERKDVLSALLWLLATLAYRRYLTRPALPRFLLVAALFALGFAAKAMVVTLPIVLLLLDWWPLGRLRSGAAGSAPVRTVVFEKIPLLAISAAGSLLAIAAQRASGALAQVSVYRPAWRAANAVISYAVYLGKTLWPAGLAAFYPFRLEAPPLWQTAGALLLVATLSVSAIALARRAPQFLVGWSWYLVTLLPVIGVVQVGGQARADRYLYLPMIGLGIAAAWCAPALAGRLRLRTGALAALAVAGLAPLALAASRQAEHWRSNETLFRNTLAVTGENWVAESFLGAEALRAKRPGEAIERYRAAARLNPTSAALHHQLGILLGDAGQAAEGVRELRAALWLDPGLADARYRLGHLLAATGELPEALEALRAAARLLPGRADVWIDLGDTASRLGLLPEAEEAFREALRLQPDSPLARWNLQRVQAARAPSVP